MARRASSRIVLASIAASLLAPGAVRAHWCDDLWDSSYNIVVKPASDAVSVPASGSATLDVYVQNNMGYPLENFVLGATATGFDITAVRQTPKVAGYLMPGEKLKYTLSIAKAGGATLAADSLDFYVSFGDSVQSQYYGRNGTAAMVRKGSGALSPPSITKVSGNEQALHLQSSANADFGDLGTALDALMSEYCAGRGAWDSGYGTPVATYCASATATSCPASVTRGATKYDYQHLWAAGELAYRKASLGSRLPVLRARLRCGWNDGMLTFKAFAGFLLGYLGEDAGARTFLEGVVASGSADEKVIAKAALVLMGRAADLSSYRADLQAALSTGSDQAQMVAAAALGIVDKDDSAVEAELITRARWIEPDTSDDGRAFLAAHLLNLVAWDRRVWAPKAGDVGEVSFFAGSGTEPVDGGAGGGGGGSGGGGGGSGQTVKAGGCAQGAVGAAASLLALLLLPALRRRM
jgi:uncharacterized membrane protein YgcG